MRMETNFLRRVMQIGLSRGCWVLLLVPWLSLGCASFKWQLRRVEVLSSEAHVVPPTHVPMERGVEDFNFAGSQHFTVRAGGAEWRLMTSAYEDVSAPRSGCESFIMVRWAHDGRAMHQ